MADDDWDVGGITGEEEVGIHRPSAKPEYRLDSGLLLAMAYFEFFL
jgi:hypothetical protein